MNNSRDTVLEEDIAYAFGDLLEKPWQPIDELLRDTRKIENTLLAIETGLIAPLSGAYHFNFEWSKDGKLKERSEPIHPNWIPIQRRSIDLANELLDISPPHCFFYISMNDARFFNWQSVVRATQTLPVFQHHRRKGQSAIIHPLRGYHEHPSSLVPTLKDNISFRDKVAKVVWRGGLRGYHYDGTNYQHVDAILRDHVGAEAELEIKLRKIARYRLSVNRDNNDIADIAYVVGDSQAYLRQYPLIVQNAGSTMAPNEQLNYRYILALNGNDWPSNIYWAINSNSVVFVEESEWEIHGGNRLRAWENYVPVTPDADDIRAKFEWCEKHTDECTVISRNAREAWRVIFDPALQAKRATAIRKRYVFEWRKRFGNKLGL
jgi:hypothetical protein